MAPANSWELLLEELRSTLGKDACDDALRALLADRNADDIVLAMEELEPEAALRVFAALGRERSAQVLGMVGSDLARQIANMFEDAELAKIIALMPDREAAEVLAEQPRESAHESVARGAVSPVVAREASTRARWPENSAGRLMTEQFIRLDASATCGQALDAVRAAKSIENLPTELCVVERLGDSADPHDRLLGVVSLRDVLNAPAEQPVREVMATDLVTTHPETRRTDAARLLSKHKFSALPVVDGDRLAGLIPAEDLMQAALAELHNRYSKAVGTDAEAMERMTPFQAALKRLPWLLGTMVIELGAGLVISRFDAVLKKVILLASFMPVISAVAGNVGLQAAAITVRAIDQGRSIKAAGAALVKEIGTTLMMALACGAVLGLVGGVWARHVVFGGLIGMALTASMLTAAVMGTLFPIVSKRLGFDPATTAGPFETAFQDIIGFGVFLGLATLLAGYLESV